MKIKTEKTQNGQLFTKVFDIARPGTSRVSANSRHVIVGRKSQAPDPMMAQPGQIKATRRTLMDGNNKVSIEPPEPKKQTPAPAPKSPIATKPPALAEPAPTTPRSAPIPVAQVPEKRPLVPRSESGYLADLSADDLANLAQRGTTTNSARNVMPFQVEPARKPLPVFEDEKQDHTVQVFVSHHPSHSRPMSALLLIVLVVVFTLVALDLLLDGGVLSVNIPHTHLL